MEAGPKEVRELIRAFNAMLDRMAASQRSQRDFVSSVSHELKTPLTSIQGFAQAIKDGTASSPEERRQAAEIIHAEAGRMHRLAVGLLDLAALDAGTVELRNAPVDLHEVLAQLCSRFEPIATLAGVTLEFDLPTELSAVAGDGDRLLQVFTNLVDNAIKFTPPGGGVNVRAEQDRGETRVVVRDTGPGMSVEELTHIFERFYQADAARGGGDKHGAGLGLPIARELTEAHGGRISVRSTLGHGAEYVVPLPPVIGSGEDRGAA
jgi:two-component system sensor histidine kinase ResE